MSAVICALYLVAACTLCGFGVVRLGCWFMDNRVTRQAEAIRQSNFVALARADLAQLTACNADLVHLPSKCEVRDGR